MTKLENLNFETIWLPVTISLKSAHDTKNNPYKIEKSKCHVLHWWSLKKMRREAVYAVIHPKIKNQLALLQFFK